MGTFHVNGEVAGIRKSGKTIPVSQMLVDTGSEFTWIPEPLLRQAGVSVVKKDLQFVMANGQTITRSIGYAILHAAGFETVDEVVFGQPGDLSLLGAGAPWKGSAHTLIPGTNGWWLQGLTWPHRMDERMLESRLQPAKSFSK